LGGGGCRRLGAGAGGLGAGGGGGLEAVPGVLVGEGGSAGGIAVGISVVLAEDEVVAVDVRIVARSQIVLVDESDHAALVGLAELVGADVEEDGSSHFGVHIGAAGVGVAGVHDVIAVSIGNPGVLVAEGIGGWWRAVALGFGVVHAVGEDVAGVVSVIARGEVLVVDEGDFSGLVGGPVLGCAHVLKDAASHGGVHLGAGVVDVGGVGDVPGASGGRGSSGLGRGASGTRRGHSPGVLVGEGGGAGGIAVGVGVVLADDDVGAALIRVVARGEVLVVDEGDLASLLGLGVLGGAVVVVDLTRHLSVDVGAGLVSVASVHDGVPAIPVRHPSVLVAEGNRWGAVTGGPVVVLAVGEGVAVAVGVVAGGEVIFVDEGDLAGFVVGVLRRTDARIDAACHVIVYLRACVVEVGGILDVVLDCGSECEEGEQNYLPERDRTAHCSDIYTN
jgi:hypothetical protein